MKIKRIIVPMLLLPIAILLPAPKGSAQVKGNVIWAQYQKTSPARKAQYELARKAEVIWHRDKKDPLPFYVWEVISGERTGQYLVATSAKKWAELDSAAAPVLESWDHFSGVSQNDVVGMRTFFLDHLVAVSRDAEAPTPAPMAVLRYYKVAYGKWGDFYNLLRRFKEAADYGEWPVHYSWFSVNNGASEPMFAQSLPKQNWADMTPPEKAPLQLAMELFGPQETVSMTKLMGEVIVEEDSEILRYRPELSYVPGAGE